MILQTANELAEKCYLPKVKGEWPEVQQPMKFTKSECAKRMDTIDVGSDDHQDIRIICECNEGCGEGEEGEVAGHLENCSCKDCHDHYSKL